MTLKLSLQEAKERVLELMHGGNHWGPSVLQVMWESSELGDEDLLWAGSCFVGGIAGQQQAPCGAVSASAVYLGLRHRCSLADEQRARQSRGYAGQDAGELVKDFTEKFGGIICLNLVGVDFSKPEAFRQIREQNIFENKCDRYVQFAIEKLYELEEKRIATESPRM